MTRSPAELAVLRLVQSGKALNSTQGDDVRALIRDGLMHVTPKYDLTEKCPYRLTEAGEAALKEKA